jgi:hypothetical protein
MREGGQRITQFAKGNGSQGLEESSASGNASKRERTQEFLELRFGRFWSKIAVEDVGGRAALSAASNVNTKPGR